MEKKLKEGLTVSVVVCNPEKEMFQKFIKSLFKHTPHLKQLLIYDNGTVDISIYKNSFLSNMGGKVHITYDKKNTGFGIGHNHNLTLAEHEYFAVLNDDIEFFEDWSTPMIKEFMIDDLVGQVCMKDETCNTLNPQGIGCYVIDKEGDPEYAEASCMMMKTELARKFDLFDTDYYEFAYYEDTDLSLRLRKAGYFIKNVNVSWKHHRATTAKRTDDIDIQGHHVNNQYKFRLRWNAYLFKKRFGKTIVIKREGSLGDVFLISSLFETIKEYYPGCIIVLATKTPEMVVNNDLLDVVIPMGTPFPCDYLIDLDYSYERNADIHIVDAYKKVIMQELPEIRPLSFDKSRKAILYINKAASSASDIVLKGMGGKFAVLNVSDTWPGKQWDINNYIEVANRIKEKTDLRIIYVGTGFRINTSDLRVGDLDLTNRLELLTTAAVIAKSAMYIGFGGLLSHVAQAVNIPSVILFGCEKPECGSESIETTITIKGSVACSGCRNRVNAGTYVECPRGGECMKRITIENVFNAVMDLYITYYKDKPNVTRTNDL